MHIGYNQFTSTERTTVKNQFFISFTSNKKYTYQTLLWYQKTSYMVDKRFYIDPIFGVFGIKIITIIRGTK